MPSYKYLRISVTDNCDLSCPYCRPEYNTGTTRPPISLDDMAKAALILHEFGISHIRLTGGEPLLSDGLVEFVWSLSSMKLFKTIAITTNGRRMSLFAQRLKTQGLNGANFHIDTLDEDKYRLLTGGNLNNALGGLDAALESGLDVKLNVVLLKGINDGEVPRLISFAATIGAPIRFIELMPFCNPTFYHRHFTPIGEIACIGSLIPIMDRMGNGPASYYKEGVSGATVGLIAPSSRKFCRDCVRLRLTSRGMLKRCLAKSEDLDLVASNFDHDRIAEYLCAKKLNHNDFTYTKNQPMMAIGG